MNLNMMFFVRVKQKIESELRKPYETVLAKQCYKKLLAEKKPTEIIILLANHIGDDVYGLAYLDAFRAEHPDKKIVVIGMEKNRELLESYSPKIDRLILLSEPKDIRLLNALLYHDRFGRKALKHGIVCSIPYVFRACRTARNPDTLYQLRTNIYKVKGENITFPALPRQYKGNAIPDFSKVKDRVAILNPYALTLLKASMKMYEQIAEILLDRRYVVYTNVIGDQKPVNGTQPLRCSVADFFAIACEIPLIVSIRSGLMDLCVSANTNMYVIYENCRQVYRRAYYLKSWNTGSRIKEVYLGVNGYTQTEVLHEFTAFLNEMGPNIQNR